MGRTLRVGMVALGLLLFASMSVPAPAAAHDPNCVASVHVMFVKQHVMCDGTDHEEVCVLSTNIMFVHEDLLC